MALSHGALASNKPHLAEKSTPAWLAIWHIWAGFANSQLRCAIFQSNYSCKCPSPLLPPWSCCSDRRKSFGPSAPIAYASSVSPPDEAVAWPGVQVLGAGGCCRLAGDAGAGCRIRLSPGRGRSSSKSPRALILVLGTSGAHWPARWPQFVLTEHGSKS